MRLAPRTILCVGRNYVDHAKELGNAVNLGEPFFFLKPASSIVQLPDPIRLPEGADVHYEVELALILKKRAHRLKTEEEAKAVVGGYFVAIDLTARNWQNEAKGKGLPWTKAKGCDTFLACGDIVPASAVVDPNNVTLRLSVNKNVKQQDSTSLMIHNVWKLLIHASAYLTLDENDVLLTGTPKGVGPLKVGDEVTIGGVGKESTFHVREWK